MDPIHESGLAQLEAEYRLTNAIGCDESALVELAEDTNAIVVRSGVRLQGDLIRHARALEVIARAGAGVDNIDLAAARDSGVVVFNVPGTSARAVAELAIGLTLSLARNICLADRQVRRNFWNKPGLVGSELLGKVLGVVGLGRIGSEMASLGRALGMRVVTSVANPTPARASALAGQATELMDVDDLLSVADIVCLAVPLTNATSGLIGERELARMKPSALLVNVARAEVVDEDDLCRALRDGVIAGAATDVVTKEAYSGLSELDNSIVTPHIGAMTHEAQVRIAAQVVAGLRAAFSGQEVPNRIL